MLGICQLVGWWQMILCWFSTPALWFLLTLCLPPSILMMTGHHPMGEVRPRPPVCILYELWVEKPQNLSTNYLLCVVQLLLHHRQNHQCTPCHLLGWVRQEEALWWMDLSWIAGWAQGLLLHEVRLRLVDPILAHAAYHLTKGFPPKVSWSLMNASLSFVMIHFAAVSPCNVVWW